MKRVSKTMVKKGSTEPARNWPKCDFCGYCHPEDPSKCPRIKSFDRNFNVQGKKP